MKSHAIPGLNHGTPPAAAEQYSREAVLQEFATHEALTSITSAPPSEDMLSAMTLVGSTSVATTTPKVFTGIISRTEKVELSYAAGNGHPGFKLFLEVEEVSITNFWISLLNPSSRFEPTDAMKLILRCRERDHAVQFLGGCFDFEKRNIHGISFLRLQEVARSQP